MLQYRKRYELLQLGYVELNNEIVKSYNTASGMNCCNIVISELQIKILGELQYRKRYELLQLCAS